MFGCIAGGWRGLRSSRCNDGRESAGVKRHSAKTRAPGGPILSGAVQVFDRDGGFWAPETYLKAANPTEEASFCVVAVSGDTVVVGAPGTGGRDQSIGSFYMFE